MTTDESSEASNPYQPPLEALPNRKSVTREFKLTWWAAAWPVALSLNLIIPMLIAWDITSRGGRPGMWLAVGVFLLSGWVLCVIHPSSARRLIVGSVALSFTQFFPVLQLFAGMFAFGVVNFLSMSQFPNSLSEEFPSPTVFIVTSIVGVCLAAVAYMLGITIFALANAWRGGTKPPSPVAIDYFNTDQSNSE